MTHPISILLVEDELLLAKSTAKKIENSGYKVSKIVSSGQAAIDYVNQEQPDLILMDIVIKGDIDGIETASRIKSKVDVPIIFLTAYANDETLERAAQTGCYSYLIKPCREKEIKAIIKMTLSKHDEQSAIQNALQDTIHQYSEENSNIYKDNLTGLPNKLFLRDVFDYFLSLIVKQEEDQKIVDKSSKEDIGITSGNSSLKFISVFNINLNRLNKVCSYLNEEEQNSLIIEVGERLKNCASSFLTNCSTVFIQSDNFVVLLAIEDKATAYMYGSILIDELKQSIQIGDRNFHISPTVGISFYPDNSLDLEELLDQGKKAGEYAQLQGGNRCQAFSFAFNVKDSKSSNDIRLESELYEALERQEFELFYQPQLDLQSNLIVGVEALVRWNHPKMGRIESDRFMPLAEDIGLTRPIGKWVLQTACKQLKKWHDRGLNTMSLSINISGAQFRQSDLFHKITQVLFETSLEANYLELELTEKILVDNIKTNVQRLNLLKKLGIQISLDNFGTGYASLGYLQQFPFDILKIDPCFVRRIDKNQVNAVITQNIIALAHQLGLKVIAQGVQTSEELRFLKNSQCDFIQGSVFSRPLEAKEFFNFAQKPIIPINLN